MMRHGRAWLAGALVVAVVAMESVVGCARFSAGGDGGAAASTSTGAMPRPLAGRDVLAMLGELKTGDVLAGYVVEEIGGVGADGGVKLRLAHDGASITLLVTLAPEDDEPRAPARTEKYAVYYEANERGRAAPEEDCQRATKALAERMEAVEATVPTPAGMKRPQKVGRPA